MKCSTLAILAILFFGCKERQATKTGLEGQTLPAFTVLLADSTTEVNTDNIPAGKPIVLFFFSPTCPYCKAETRQLVEDMGKLKDIRFLMVTNYSFPQMKAFIAKYKLASYPNVTIGFDPTSAVMNYYKATIVPYTALYDKNKKMHKAFIGYTDSKTVEESIGE